MTNTMIILLESVELMKQGVLAGTGKKVVVDTKDGKKEVEMPEVIHTFAVWKELGYSVKKGEHAIAKFPIWKYTAKYNEETDKEEDAHMFMKVAHFFKASQVEKIKELQQA